MTTTTLRLHIGRRTVAVGSFRAASAAYAAARDASGAGASGFPAGRLTDADGRTYVVSYNGKIWRGDTMERALVFSPYAP